MVQNAVGRVQIGGADLEGVDLVDEAVAPPLQWPVIDAMNERRGGRHNSGSLSSGSCPAGRSIRAPVAHGFMCTQDNYTSLHLIVAPC